MWLILISVVVLAMVVYLVTRPLFGGAPLGSFWSGLYVILGIGGLFGYALINGNGVEWGSTKKQTVTQARTMYDRTYHGYRGRGYYYGRGWGGK